MKRIDDKIKEIEKKDKTNRWLYYGIVVLLVAFLSYVSTTRKAIKEKDATIESQEGTIAQQLETQKLLNQQLADSIEVINSSLKPLEYWNHINNEKSVEGYIDYITNEWGIDKPEENVVKAYESLHSNNLNVQLEGWIYVGQLNNSGVFSDSKNRSKIIWPHSREGKKPEKNDILQLTYDRNLSTYSKPTHKKRFRKDEGWRPGTKAFVVNTHYNSNESNDYFVKIKYY